MHRLLQQPDTRLIHQTMRWDTAALTIAAVVGGMIALWWLWPASRPFAPQGWSLMKFNTATSLLLAVASAALQGHHAARWHLQLGRGLGCVVLLLAALNLVQWITGLDLGIDEWLVADESPSLPGRMSLQTTAGYVLVGATLLCLHNAKDSKCGHVADGLAMLMVVLVLTVAAGYLFNATKLFGSDEMTRMSPQTLLGFGCMALVFGVRRARRGFSEALMGLGVGSQLARSMMPIGILLPAMLTISQSMMVTRGWLHPSYAAALHVTLASSLIMLLVLWMARRLNVLEANLRMASLTDELTGVSNRRGFMTLGELALAGVRRHDDESALLYFVDVDGLKRVNDELGHEAGSTLIKTVADTLRNSFRSSDVVGRIGGDEFCVLAVNSVDAPERVIHRLRKRAIDLRERQALPFDVQFSVGAAKVDPSQPRALEEAMRLADERMYAIKQQRKTTRRSVYGSSQALTRKPLQPAL